MMLSNTRLRESICCRTEDDTIIKYQYALHTRLTGSTDVDHLVIPHWDFITSTRYEIKYSRLPPTKSKVEDFKCIFKIWELIDNRKKLQEISTKERHVAWWKRTK